LNEQTEDIWKKAQPVDHQLHKQSLHASTKYSKFWLVRANRFDAVQSLKVP